MANDNKGAFFTNEKKASDNHPSYTGTCTIEGKEYRVSIWPKTSNAGKKFWSMAFTPKESEATPQNAKPDPFDINSEELPF